METSTNLPQADPRRHNVGTFLENSMLFQNNSPEVFCKKCILNSFPKFTGKNASTRVSFLTRAQVFSCALCKIYIKSFFTEHLPLGDCSFPSQNYFC